MPRVVISLVNYNQKDLLDRCLEHLGRAQIDQDWHTIVLDNKSTDGSAEMVDKKYPWVEQIRNHKNDDYGRGHNIVYSKTDSLYFIVLNPDIIIDPGSLQSLVDKFEKFPRAAVIGPCLLNPDGSLQYSARHDYDWRTVIARRLPFPGRQRIIDHHLMKDYPYESIHKVDWVMGAVLAVRRQAFPEQDLFDPVYRKYFEDVDLCYFARQAGWDVLYCPDIKIIHDHQRVSAQKWFNKVTMIHISSWLKFYIKTKRRH
ncbi:MAG: hypothetical protein DRP65_02245 [Planctomycetota bacterium]|nr:MAG: hypothetical protein DRP65_02245 [Planctomycetota bacterium]